MEHDTIKRASKHKVSHDTADHGSKRKRKHKSDKESGSKRRHKGDAERHIHIVDDDPDADMWEEKNIDMDGEEVRVYCIWIKCVLLHLATACRSQYPDDGEPEIDFACFG